jgi:hypothetical protein
MCGTPKSPTDRSYEQCQAKYLEANKRVRGKNSERSPAFSGFTRAELFRLLSFGYIKGMLQEPEVMEKDDHFAEIREFSNTTPGKVLKVVFLEWEKRV